MKLLEYDSERINFIYTDDNSKDLIGRISINCTTEEDPTNGIQDQSDILSIIKNINDMDLPINQKRPQDGLSIKPGIGLFQPPKNAATATPLTTNILAYSLKKKKA
jgi:hypothetical protein